MRLICLIIAPLIVGLSNAQTAAPTPVSTGTPVSSAPATGTPTSSAPATGTPVSSAPATGTPTSSAIATGIPTSSAPATGTTTLTPTATIVSDSPSSFPVAAVESDPPSSAPTFGVADRPCAEQEAIFRGCLNTTMSFADAEKCDDCVAASFPAPNNVCEIFQSSVCTALTRDCDCGDCKADIESYIDCALEEAGRDNCGLECNYDSCDAPQFLFTSCMEEAGFTDDGTAACVNCTLNALSNGGPIETCDDATGRICPAIKTDCGCGSCRAELEAYMSCDTIGKEIPSNCTVECGLSAATNDRTDDTTPAADSAALLMSKALPAILLTLPLLL